MLEKKPKWGLALQRGLLYATFTMGQFHHGAIQHSPHRLHRLGNSIRQLILDLTNGRYIMRHNMERLCKTLTIS